MTNEQVWDKAEELRAKFETLKADKIPLDLISFVELDLRLDLIPYDRLKDDFGADAAIFADFSGFYIDGEIFDRIDMVRGAQLNRLRFSIAHELDHLFLHREAFKAVTLETNEHFLDWLNQHDGRKYDFEREANEFDGRLLVPVEILKDCFEKMLPTMDQKYGRYVWVSNAEIRSKTAELIKARFGVRPIPIETRFDREKIWPSPF
ncbi:MAG: ImmA/IrrE family metallo-endopeptidase [Akkermansiaceae bacterium]